MRLPIGPNAANWSGSAAIANAGSSSPGTVNWLDKRASGGRRCCRPAAPRCERWLACPIGRSHSWPIWTNTCSSRIPPCSRHISPARSRQNTACLLSHPASPISLVLRSSRIRHWRASPWKKSCRSICVKLPGFYASATSAGSKSKNAASNTTPPPFESQLHLAGDEAATLFLTKLGSKHVAIVTHRTRCSSRELTLNPQL